MFRIRFASIKRKTQFATFDKTCWHDLDLTYGDYVKVNGLKTEDEDVKPEEDEEEDVKPNLKREGKKGRIKRSGSYEDDVKFCSIKSKKFTGKGFREEKWMPAQKKQKMSPSPRLSQVPDYRHSTRENSIFVDDDGNWLETVGHLHLHISI